MQGGKNKQPLGYTIVEVLIVLAISSMMFLIAANFINGKQERASFDQGVNEMASRLQDLLSQVTDGHYSDIPVSCPPPAGTGGPATQQGRNQECVFLGKVMHFYLTSITTPVQNYKVFSLAAARTATGPLPNPAVAAVPGLTTQTRIPQNLEIKTFTITPTTGSSVSSNFNIGFAQGLGTPDTQSAGGYKSGSQTVNLIYVNTLNPLNAGNETNVTGNRIRPATSATMCLSNDSRAAQIFIGGTGSNGNQLGIKVKQLGKRSCP